MKIHIDDDELKSLVKMAVRETIELASQDERLAYTEMEAAKLIGVARHVLRDERLRGRVPHGKCGKKIVYSKRQLLEFIEGRVN